MKNRPFSRIKEMDDGNQGFLSSSRAIIRQFLFVEIVKVSLFLGLSSLFVFSILEFDSLLPYSFTIFLFYAALGILFYSKNYKAVAIFGLIFFFPVCTLFCILIQPVPAIGGLQFTYLLIFFILSKSFMENWLLKVLMMCMSILSFSMHHWYEASVVLEHSLIINSFLLIMAIILQLTVIYNYQKYLEKNRANLAEIEQGLVLGLKHIKAAPWSYSHLDKSFLPSPKFVDMWQISREASADIKEALLNYLSKENANKILAAIENPLEVEGFDFVYETIWKGKRTFYHIRGENFYDKDGQALELLGSVEDISKRKIKEEEIAYGQSLLAASLESHVNGILVMDKRGKVEQCNSRFLEMWDMEEASLKNKQLMKVADKLPVMLENPEVFFRDVNIVQKNRQAETFSEISLIDGRTFEVYSKPHVHKGEVVGRILSCRDITEKKRAEELLKNSEEKYRTLFGSSADGILLLDLDERKAVDCNEQMLKLFKASRDEILRANTLTFSPTMQPDKVPSWVKREEYFKVERGVEEIRRFEWLYQDSKGIPFYAEVIVSPFDYQGRSMAIHIIRDISKRKALMEELEHKNLELEEKVRERTLHLEISNAELKRSNDDLEQFAYAASHDLREPLRMVGNFVGLLSRDYAAHLDEKAHRYVKFATQGVKRMTEQMKALLEFSMMGRSEMNWEEVDLNEILEQNIVDLSVYLKERGAKIHLPPESISLNCEPLMLGILFNNLISNGLKFNNSIPPQIWISYQDVGTFIKVCVRDNGIGISKDNQKKIFEVFKRLHRPFEFEGTGIGLALCRKIVHRHEGEIWVDSIPGKGSSFCFTLPIRKKISELKPISVPSEQKVE
ncbi:MAG: ATP-binding protein [Bacteroidota bacterium]